jgi:hypothetical protein
VETSTSPIAWCPERWGERCWSPTPSPRRARPTSCASTRSARWC